MLRMIFLVALELAFGLLAAALVVLIAHTRRKFRRSRCPLCGEVSASPALLHQHLRSCPLQHEYEFREGQKQERYDHDVDSA